MSGLAWTDLGGDGPTFVLVHGYTGSSDDFRSVIAPLTAKRRVVLVDQLGHGDSPRAARYSFDILSRALVEFLLVDIGQPVDLLGHSMGGRTVLPIAIHQPELVRSLVLMDTWADHPDRGDRAEDLKTLFGQPDDAVAAALAAGALDRPDPERELHVAQWSEAWVDARESGNAARLDPNAQVQLGRQVFVDAPSVLDACRAIAGPATVLRGEFDLPFVGASQRMLDAITGSVGVIIDGAYHSPQLSHPRDWTAAVMAHLERVDAG